MPLHWDDRGSCQRTALQYYPVLFEGLSIRYVIDLLLGKDY